MSDKPVFEVPEWDDFYNTWKIVIILLALVLLLLMLFGLGPGGRCSQVTAVAACNAVSESDGTETTTMVGEEQTATKEKADASTTALLPAEVKVEKTVNEEVLETAISKEEKSGLKYLKVNSTKQKVYFATDSYELPEGYAKPLKSIVIEMISDNRWVAVISGFHDETGSLSYNQELAKMRAIAVRDALASVGINPSRIILEKPQSTLGKGSNAEARRVEVILADLVDD